MVHFFADIKVLDYFPYKNMPLLKKFSIILKEQAKDSYLKFIEFEKIEIETQFCLLFEDLVDMLRQKYKNISIYFKINDGNIYNLILDDYILYNKTKDNNLLLKWRKDLEGIFENEIKEK